MKSACCHIPATYSICVRIDFFTQLIERGIFAARLGLGSELLVPITQTLGTNTNSLGSSQKGVFFFDNQPYGVAIETLGKLSPPRLLGLRPIG
jgi:hypothetical protein